MKAIIRFFSRCVFFIFGVFFVLPVLYFIEIFIEIRIAFPHSDRIGDFNIYNYVLWHREFRGVKINAKPRQIFLLCPKYVANIQLFKMWRRVLPIYQVHALLFAGTYFFAVLRKTRFFWELEGFGFEHEEFSHSEPPLSFTEEEESLGWAELEKIGIAKTDWFICLHARDPAYLGTRENFGTQALIENIRDCSIENYLLAAEWITEQGGFAIRMGAVVNNPLPENLHPNIIDYATQYRSDFLDIFLAAKCKFFLGNSSGITWLPLSFGGVMGAANMVPLHDIGHGNRCLFIPKILRNRVGEPVAIDRILALGLGELSRHVNPQRYTQEFYTLLDMYWDENSNEDILDFCKDLMNFTPGKVPNSLDEAQRVFHEIYANTNHACLYAPRVGPSFARKYYNP